MTPEVADQGAAFDPFSNPGLPSSWVVPPEAVTVRVIVVVWVLPPPVPVTVTVEVPVAVDAPTVIVSVDDPDPGAAIDVGLKPAVAPVGSPDAESEIAELKLPIIVVEMVELPELPCAIDRAEGNAVILKSALEAVTVKLTVVVCVLPPPVPVIVTVEVPVAVDVPTVIVIVDDPPPGAAIDVGLKPAVAPVGSPEAESETAELKLPTTDVDIVDVPEPPCVIDSEVGDAEIVKSEEAAVTVRLTAVVCVLPPPEPVIVMVEVPVGVDAPAVIVMVEEPDPGAAIDEGEKLAVAPVGSPDADSDTAELKLPEIVVDIVEFPEPPCATESEVGDADIEKSLLEGLKITSSTG